jgi:hypothetical protein
VKSTTEVLDLHLKCFAARDIDGVMEDYPPDAVYFGLEGLLRGPNAIKPVFEKLFAEFAKPDVLCAKAAADRGRLRVHRLDRGDSRQFVRTRQRHLCYSERKHPPAGFDRRTSSVNIDDFPAQNPMEELWQR